MIHTPSSRSGMRMGDGNYTSQDCPLNNLGCDGVCSVKHVACEYVRREFGIYECDLVRKMFGLDKRRIKQAGVVSQLNSGGLK